MSDVQSSEVLDANTSPVAIDRGESIPSVEKAHPDLSHIRAVYFDLDDTLCGYWDASKAALRIAFQEHGPDGYSHDDLVFAWAQAFREFAPTLKSTGWYDIYLKTAEPTRTEQMRRMLLVLGIDDVDRAQRLSESYMVNRDRNLKLFPDAIDVLEALKPRFPLGLITNGPADIQRQEINTLGIEAYFQNIYIEGEMGEGKPKPSVFTRATEAVGCEPNEILMVGNSFRHDIAAAMDNGWHAVWVRRPSDIPPSQTAVEEMPEGARVPDAVINHLSELLPFLG